jgi:hypothetical protein
MQGCITVPSDVTAGCAESGDALSTAGETPALLVGDEFDDDTVSPAILGAGECLDLANQAEVGRSRIFAGAENTGGGRKLALFDANLHLRVRTEVPDPMRGVVFGDDVEAAFALGIPDLDLAESATFAASGGQVEIWIAAVDVTGL